MAAVDRARPAPACCRPSGCSRAPVQRDLVRSWPTPADHDGLDARPGRAGGTRAVGHVGPGAPTTTAVDCRYAGQSHELTVPTRRRLPRGPPTAQRLRPARRARRGHRPPRHRHHPGADRARPTCPAPIGRRPSDRSPSPSRTAPSGSRPAGRPQPGAAGALVLAAGAVDDPRPRRPPGAHLPPRRDRRRDGRGPAPVRRRAPTSRSAPTARPPCSPPSGELLAQAEHIPVHLGSMPASVRAAIDAYPSDLGPDDHVVVNDPFAGGTHLNDITVVTPAFADGRARGLGRQPGPPRRRRRCRPGLDPGRRHRHPAGGPPHPADPLQRRAARAAARRLAHPGRAGRRPRRPARRQRRRRRAAARRWPGEPLDEVVAYGERRMRAVARRAARRHVAVRGRRSTPPARRPTSSARPGSSSRSRWPATRSPSTSPARDPQARGNVNAVEAVTVSAVAFALRTAVDPDDPGQRRLDAPGPRRRARRARSSPPRFPAAVGAGNVEVSQRVADVCLGALAQVLPDRVGAAGQGTMNNVLIGGDGLGVLRDDRRRPGRPARPGRHERRPHRDDQHQEHADRGAGARLPDAGAALPAARGQRRRGPVPRAATASSATCRCSRTARCSLITERRVIAAVGPRRRRPGRGGGELAAARWRRGAGRATARQVHRAAAGRRRRADAHTRRRWVG